MRCSGRSVVMVAGAFVLLAGVAYAQQGNVRFADVSSDAYFFEAVERFARKGIIKGYDDGRFGPHDYVTRGQVAVIVDRYDQQIIKLLRAQVEQIRAQLNLGICGDAVVQLGEGCDDGNAYDGDGCSAECLEELHCAGGYRIGESFTAPDGCNVCSCTEAGVACTQNTCTQKKCFSSAECRSGELCSVEQGDCRFPCPKGAACIQACAGVCLPRPSGARCGNGICEGGETAFVDRSGMATFCPQDCTIDGPVCGDGACEEWEADQYRLECAIDAVPCVAQPTLTRRGTCPSDCEEGLSICDQRLRIVNDLFERKRECEIDSDCTVFIRACTPYQTCGKPVQNDAILEVTAAALEFIAECPGGGPPTCAACLPNTALCIEGVCEVREAEAR